MHLAPSAVALTCPSILQVHGGVDLRLSVKTKGLHHRVPSDEALMSATRKFLPQAAYVLPKSPTAAPRAALPPPSVPPLQPAAPDSAPFAAPVEGAAKGSKCVPEAVLDKEVQEAMAAVTATKAKGALLPGVDVVSLVLAMLKLG